VAIGVIGFGNSEILDGRPFGGCAIIWRASMNLQATPIQCNSRRVCGVLFTNQNIKLLCICFKSVTHLLMTNFSISCL